MEKQINMQSFHTLEGLIEFINKNKKFSSFKIINIETIKDNSLNGENYRLWFWQYQVLARTDMKREFITALNKPKRMDVYFELEQGEWDFARKSPKQSYGLGFEGGAMWAYYWLKKNGYIVDKNGSN